VRLGDGRTKGALPNLVVIGAQKCGTTSLHYYLGRHPEISMSGAKELDFFVSWGSWTKGLDWYAAQFDAAAPVRGESSPSYTDYPRNDGVAERMHSVLPEAKLVYLVRDPIDRIVSHYLHDYSVGRLEQPLEEVLGGPQGERYTTRSRYFLQLEQYLSHYPLERILVVAQEELLADRAATIRRVFEFLGVDASFGDPRFERIMHPTSHRRRKTRLLSSLEQIALRAGVPKSLTFQAQRRLPYPFARRLERPQPSDSLRQSLIRELEGDVKRLREVTGQEFPHWCV
jgi:Sulfotransferase domain